MIEETRPRDIIAAAYGTRRPDEEAMLLVAHVEALRPRERIRLLTIVPSYEELLALDQIDVEMIIGRPLHTTRWNPRVYERRIDRDRLWLSHELRGVLWPTDSAYPELLREIYDPPATLFVRGSIEALERPTVAVVGTRRPDPDGIGAAVESGSRLAEAGFAVASGLAYGIDVAAHRGVVGVNGTAIAVLGSGIDAVYPSGNRGLAATILESGGAVVSEYAPGTDALKFHFPARNRIIVGLSVAVLVVEAPESSGALISADFALGENRDLYVHRTGTSWAGTARLVSEGSPVVCTGTELVEAVGRPRGEELAQTPIAHASSTTGRGASSGSTVTDTRARSEREKLALFGPVYAELDDRAMRYRLAMQHEEEKR